MNASRNVSLILASQSAQRALLLKQLGLPFEQKSLADLNVNDVESLEMELPQELPENYVARVAKQKWLAAQQALAHLPRTLLLTADTTVSIGNTILHKPENTQQAYEMISALSGQTHDVRTAICVGWGSLFQSDLPLSHVVKLCHSRVSFAPLTPGQCWDYACSGEGLGRAGGYAIQGKAAMLICHIEGSYSSIMGLPLFETARALEQLGIVLI